MLKVPPVIEEGRPKVLGIATGADPDEVILAGVVVLVGPAGEGSCSLTVDKEEGYSLGKSIVAVYPVFERVT